uniref:Putative transposase n=1 Tax=Escherichia coli TaxID=562 RepID=Q08JB4_ECOLX|nr:putative transposase [Escherichia coli]
MIRHSIKKHRVLPTDELVKSGVIQVASQKWAIPLKGCHHGDEPLYYQV